MLRLILDIIGVVLLVLAAIPTISTRVALGWLGLAIIGFAELILPAIS